MYAPFFSIFRENCSCDIEFQLFYQATRLFYVVVQVRKVNLQKKGEESEGFLTILADYPL